MFADLVQPFLVCIMFLSWAGLYANEVNLAVKEYVEGQEEDYEKQREELMKMLEQVTEPPCDVASCTMLSLDCDEAGPPPYCPRNVTICRSGCACIKYCKDMTRTLYCYQVKFCRTPRRISPDFFTTMKMMLD